MKNRLEELTHLDAIGVMAQFHYELRQNPRSSLRELKDATAVLGQAEEYQLCLTQDHFDFEESYGP